MWQYSVISVGLVLGATAQLRVELPFTVGNEKGEHVELVVGVDERATERIDTSLGEREIPPFHPPAGVFHAALRFYDSVDGEWKWTYRDFRPLRRSDTFSIASRFVVQRGDARTIVLQWEYPLPERIDSAIVTDRITGTLVRIPFGEQQQAPINNEFLEEFVLTVWYRFAPATVAGERKATEALHRVILYDITGRLCWAGEYLPNMGEPTLAPGVYLGLTRQGSRWQRFLWMQP